jgi:hypothetical protein
MKIIKKNKYRLLSNIAKYSFIFVFMVILVTPNLFVNAELGTGDSGMGTGTEIKIGLENPLDGIETIPEFIEAIINIVLIIGVPIVVLAVIYVGFLFVKAQGNPEEIIKAKKALLYTLIGAALLLGAFVIANAIGKTVDEIKSTT